MDKSYQKECLEDALAPLPEWATGVVLRPSGSYGLYEFSAKEYADMQSDLRTRNILLSAGMDEPTGLDKFIIILLANSVVTPFVSSIKDKEKKKPKKER
jgi:hypothetical protein